MKAVFSAYIFAGSDLLTAGLLSVCELAVPWPRATADVGGGGKVVCVVVAVSLKLSAWLVRLSAVPVVVCTASSFMIGS